MKKKRIRILAAVLSGALLLSLAIPAALAAEADNETNEAAQTETVRPERESRRGRPENGRPENETDEDPACGRRHGRGSGERHEEPAEPENAIGKDAAKELALSDAELTAEQVKRERARLSDKDGTLVYKVSFKYDGQKYSYMIDPESGEILDKTVSEATGHSRRPHERASEPEAAGNTVGA